MPPHLQRGQLERRYVDQVANLKISNSIMDKAKVTIKACVAKFQTLLFKNTILAFPCSNFTEILTAITV